MNVNPQSPLSPNAPGAGEPNPATDGDRYRQVDPLRVFRQHARTLVVTAIIGFLLSVGLWGALLVYWPQYTSQAQLQITGAVRDPYGDLQQSGGIDQERMDILAAFIQNQVIRLLSDEVLSDALQREEVRQTAWFQSFPKGANGEPDARKALESLQDRLTAGQIRGSTLIRVSMSDADVKGLPKIVDAVIEVYLNKMRLDNEIVTGDVRRTFVEERKRVESELRQIQEQLKQFAAENDLPNLENRGQEAEVNYKTLSQHETDLRLDYQAARTLYQNMVTTLQQGRVIYTPEEMAQVASDPAIARRDEELRQLQETKDVFLAQGFGEKHRAVRQVDDRVLAVKEQRKRELDRLLRQREQVQLETAKKAVDSLGGQLTGLQPQTDEARLRMRELGLKLEEYRRIASLARTTDERRAKLDEALNDIRVRQARLDNNRVRRVQYASTPELTFPLFAPVSIGASLLILMLVTGVVFLREILDQRIKSPADLLTLPSRHVLGVLPQATDDPSGPARIEGVVGADPTGLMAEAYRQVRTSLLTQMDRRGYKTLLLVGAQAQCGVSTATGNLAMSLASQGRRVLVIDANFRRPSQHTLFNAPQTPGLVELLRGQRTMDEAVVQTDWDNLAVLPVGDVSNAAPELLDSQTFRDLLAQCAKRYDMVLIDAPPALVTTDAHVLVRQADAVVVVVRATSDKRGMVSRMIRQLQGQRAEMLGVILNAVRTSAGGYFRKNYKAFYLYGQNGSANGSGRAAKSAATQGSAAS